MTASACGDAVPAPVTVVERVYFAEAHETEIDVQPGDTFAVALPMEAKVAKLIRRDPRRPRVDGKILTMREMGAIPDAWLESAGGPGLAYVFEAKDNGRSKVVVFDAAHREIFKMNVMSGDRLPEPVKGRVREPKAQGRQLPDSPIPRPQQTPVSARPKGETGGQDAAKARVAGELTPP